MLSNLFLPLVIIIALAISLWLYILLPMQMARKRGRNVLGWVLLFWLITPFWGIIALLVLGDSQQKIREDIMDDLHQNY